MIKTFLYPVAYVWSSFDSGKPTICVRYFTPESPLSRFREGKLEDMFA